ncbi:SusC/RagA family TonB-linked outer membrane protein [Halalkalibaculum sp. DA384]|uniref:SusC/RagA family TonB-linked outer membrane protein n=1 Tax=Halalkalibaculum sp. DA384 TaxID=3373606 RepID=UPI003754809A
MRTGKITDRSVMDIFWRRLLFFIGLMVVCGTATQAFAKANMQEELTLQKLVSNSVSQETRVVSLDFEETPLIDALKQLARKARVGFSFNPDIIPDKKVTAKFEGITVRKVLYSLLDGTDLEIKLPPSKDVIVVKEKPKKVPDLAVVLQATVRGTVTDAQTGDPLPGANVSIQGTTTGSSTNAEGEFTITGVEPGTYTFVASFIGYETSTQEVTITEGENELTINFSLQPSDIAMEEMVVIGYGEQERSEITGSISSVDGEQITSGQTADGVQKALQGRIAGVNVSTKSGAPGSAADINIRGVATFGNSNPLYVIDGVPVFSGDNTNINPLATLNPGNIESVEVLKDASASAIYGARAANGVIIITTKSGQAGETNVEANLSGGVSVVTDYLSMMNSEQYVEYSSEAYENAGVPLPVSLTEPQLSENLKTDTDWGREGFSPAYSQEFSLSLSGGNENATYAFSTGYMNEEGNIPSSGFKRYSARINSDFDIGENFRIGESIELSRAQWTGVVSPSSVNFKELLQQAPTVPVYCPENLGGFCGPTVERSPQDRNNAIGIWTLTDQENVNNRILGNVYAEYDILSNLTYRLNLNGDFTFGHDNTFTPKYEMGNRSNPTADLSVNKSNTDNYIIENTLTYQNEFKGIHDVTALIGYSQQKSWYEYISGNTTEFPNNNVPTIAAAFGQSSLNGSETGWALRSFMGRVNYGYDDKYNLMATLRRDGSSRFGENNRYGIFPSVSANWVVSSEPFMENIGAIYNLTIRASWGQVGSQQIDNFASIATISPYARYIFGEDQSVAPGATYLQLGNNNLQWETTTQKNIGLDISLLNNRLSLAMDYYIKDTDGVLLRVPIPTTSGLRRGNGSFQNAGALHNEGFELTADYNNNIGDFQYTISGNISTNKNEVTSLGNGEPIITEMTNDPNQVLSMTREGEEIGAFYGWVMEGVFVDQADLDNHADQPGAAPGDVKFKDLDGNGVINANDRKIIGSPFPDFSYGLNFNFQFKKFDASIFIQGKQGHQIYNLIWAGLSQGKGSGDNNALTVMLDRWQEPGDVTDVPRVVRGDPNQNVRPSTRFIEDGSYLRVQNLQIGYDFGERLNVPGFRLYVSGSNLLTLTGYRGLNPEVGTLTSGNQSSLIRGVDFGQYPIPKTFRAGVQVDFN